MLNDQFLANVVKITLTHTLETVTYVLFDQFLVIGPRYSVNTIR